MCLYPTLIDNPKYKKIKKIAARLDNELKKANINLTREQINSIRESVRLGWFAAANKLIEMSQKIS